MARIEGVDLPRNKRIEVALTYIFGIGPTRARQNLDGHQGESGYAGEGSDRKRSQPAA